MARIQASLYPDVDIGELASQIWGKHNESLSSRTDLRFGQHGSISVDLIKNVWFDHENDEGGGWVDLYRVVHGHDPRNGGADRSEFRIPPNMRRALGDPVACWDYKNADGSVVARVVRFEPSDGVKTYRQCRPDGLGWRWSVKDIEIPPYRLPDLLAAPADATVYVVEGEKHADALHQWGLIATTNAMGAGKFRAHHADALAGRDVVVLPDNDQAGQDHADDVAWRLCQRGARVRIVNLPELRPKGDIIDWIQDGGTLAELERLVAAAPEYTVPDAPAGEPSPLILDPAAPLLSARALVGRDYMLDGRRTLHHQQDVFYRWTGTHYEELPDEEMRALIWQFLDAAKQQRKDALVPFSPNTARVSNVIEALAAETQIPQSAQPPMMLDDYNDPFAYKILACRNGLLHLPTSQMVPPNPLLLNLNALDYDYDPQADCPVWLWFLDSLWPNDQESIDTLQEWFGLSVGAETRYQKMALLIGPKRSGKGTIGKVQGALIGRNNICAPTLHELASDRFALAPLIGKSLAIVSDARLSGRADAQMAVERLLAISGEDLRTIDRKYKSAWHGRLPTRFIIMSNELPRFDDASGAIASRFIVLQLTETFYGREDLTLTDRLMDELPGILNWALDGFGRLTQRGHFIQPKSGKDLAEQFAGLASPISGFIDDWCVIDDGAEVECDRLYQSWCAWCEQRGHRAGASHTFGRSLHAALSNIRTRREADGDRERYYIGIGLRFPTNDY